MAYNLTKSKVSTRLLSLDVFRGITVMAMILVNNPGDWGHIYAPLEHSRWNGCTPTDLVFPFFLLIMGVSIVFAMQHKKRDTAKYGELVLKILKRTAIIFVLGLFMATFLNWDIATIRIPGVLQRIAVVYLFCSMIYLLTDYRLQALLTVAILVAYYLLMTKVSVPGIGPANLKPATNLGAWLDRKVLGTAHLWSESRTWDPEGILSTLPAIATGLLGVLTGHWLKRSNNNRQTKVYGMIGAGVVLTAAGLLWDTAFPINKALWTSSYVLFTGGLGLLCFGTCYWLVDVKGYSRITKPFVVYGLNAIVVYVASGLIARSINRIHIDFGGDQVSLSSALYETFFDQFFTPLNASLAWAVCFVLAWLVVLWIMYNRNLVIKI